MGIVPENVQHANGTAERASECRFRLCRNDTAAASVPGLVIKCKNDRAVPGLVEQDARETTVRIYSRDVHIHRRQTHGLSRPSTSPIGGMRGTIKIFSEASRRRLNHVARNINTDLTHMLTLTYPNDFPCDGEVVKRHWANMRKWLHRRNIKGLQVLEFQQRGAPHIHAYVSDEVDKQELSQAWYNIVGSGDPKHLAAGTNIEKLRQPHAMLMYIRKYVTKQEQKEVPPGFENVGRFWSTFGGAKAETVKTLTGDRSAIAPVVRIVRNAAKARQRAIYKPGTTKGYQFKDRGKVGFRSWGVAPGILSYLERVGLTHSNYATTDNQANNFTAVRNPEVWNQGQDTRHNRHQGESNYNSISHQAETVTASSAAAARHENEVKQRRAKIAKAVEAIRQRAGQQAIGYPAQAIKSNSVRGYDNLHG